jgi:hypothetical protein
MRFEEIDYHSGRLAGGIEELHIISYLGIGPPACGTIPGKFTGRMGGAKPPGCILPRIPPNPAGLGGVGIPVEEDMGFDSACIA